MHQGEKQPRAGEGETGVLSRRQQAVPLPHQGYIHGNSIVRMIMSKSRGESSSRVSLHQGYIPTNRRGKVSMNSRMGRSGSRGGEGGRVSVNSRSGSGGCGSIRGSSQGVVGGGRGGGRGGGGRWLSAARWGFIRGNTG